MERRRASDYNVPRIIMAGLTLGVALVIAWKTRK